MINEENMQDLITLPGEVFEKDVLEPRNTEEDLAVTDSPSFEEVRDILSRSKPLKRPNRNRPIEKR